MTKRLSKLALSISIMALSASAQAADLMDVFQQALTGDPTFRGAEQQRLSSHENVPISASFLLPNVVGQAATQKNRQHNNSTTVVTSIFSNAGQGVFNYFSQGYQVNLSQPVFDWAAWENLSEAKASVKAADASYAASVQDLINRVAIAYFNVLNAEDNLRYTEAEKRAVYRQLDQVRQQYKVGVVAITGVYQAQAEYDSVVAQVIAAKNNIINAREDLRAITGEYYDHLAGLRTQVPLIPPVPEDAEKWVGTASNQNWSLQAARYNAEAFRKEVNVQRSGHLPTVDAYGSFVRAESGNSPQGRINTRTSAYGVEMVLPVFQGGLVTHETKQAEYNYQASLEDRNATQRSVVNNTRQAYNNVVSGISKIKADKQAIVSNSSSLRSTEEAYRVGTQTMLDVLQAQQDLYNAQRAYSQDQYDYIKATVALKEAAGTLSVDDLKKINTWLSENKASYADVTLDSIKKESSIDESRGMTQEELDKLKKIESKFKSQQN